MLGTEKSNTFKNDKPNIWHNEVESKNNPIILAWKLKIMVLTPKME